MDYIKRRLSFSSDPDKDREEKMESGSTAEEGEKQSKASHLFESLSSKRATIWNDLTSRIKADKSSTSPSGSESNLSSKGASAVSPSTTTNGFLDTVRQKIQQVKQHYENGHAEEKRDKEVECAPLIDTTDTDHLSDAEVADDEADVTTESQERQDDGSEVTSALKSHPRKKLHKKQDSFTAEEVYLDQVASKVKSGLVPPDSDTVLVSPTRAVKEFSFSDASAKTKQRKTRTKHKPASGASSLMVPDNNNLINFDSMQNLNAIASSEPTPELIVHREDDGVFEYESSG